MWKTPPGVYIYISRKISYVCKDGKRRMTGYAQIIINRAVQAVFPHATVMVTKKGRGGEETSTVKI